MDDAAESYDATVPNKTIYVSDGDLPLFQRAQELAGGNLSAAISTALKRYVESQQARDAGFESVVVRVGLGSGRKVRFTGLLVGEWVDTTGKRAEIYHVYRSRSGKYVLHIERSQDWWAVDAEGKDAGWRGWIGLGDIKYGAVPKESTLEVVDTLEQLREKVPADLYDMVARSALQPTVEELDI
jgi:EXLDI family protein